MKQIEAEHQKALVQYLILLERQGKILTFFAVPNGTYLQGNTVQRAKQMSRLKKEGLRDGVSDIVVVTLDKVLFIELKRPAKVLKSKKLSYAGINVSDHQKAFLEQINKGFVSRGEVCYGFNDAKNFIESML
jgi:hypothetical protein